MKLDEPDMLDIAWEVWKETIPRINKPIVGLV